MSSRSLFAATLLASSCLGTAWLGTAAAARAETSNTGVAMSESARLLVASFDEKQRTLALYPLESDQRFELRLAPVPACHFGRERDGDILANHIVFQVSEFLGTLFGKTSQDSIPLAFVSFDR